MATKKTAAQAAGKKEARPAAAADSEKSEALAKMALRPSVNAAAVMVSYGKPLGIDDDDIAALMDRLADDVQNVWAGDMKRAEAMLFGQAHALQAIFMNLARRATTQEYLKQWEAYLRMALKAQNQCRMTLETLATIKNPPVVIARQANINNGGQQQVNNGPATGSNADAGPARASAEETESRQSELSGGANGLLENTGASGASGRTLSTQSPVGEVHRPANG